MRIYVKTDDGDTVKVRTTDAGFDLLTVLPHKRQRKQRAEVVLFEADSKRQRALYKPLPVKARVERSQDVSTVEHRQIADYLLKPDEYSDTLEERAESIYRLANKCSDDSIELVLDAYNGQLRHWRDMATLPDAIPEVVEQCGWWITVYTHATRVLAARYLMLRLRKTPKLNARPEVAHTLDCRTGGQCMCDIHENVAPWCGEHGQYHWCAEQ